MDNPKFGEAVAKTMDRLDKLVQRGDLDGFELVDVLVIAVYTKPYEEADAEIEPDAMESFVFVDGTTQVPHVQIGILELAKDATLNPVS